MFGNVSIRLKKQTIPIKINAHLQLQKYYINKATTNSTIERNLPQFMFTFVNNYPKMPVISIVFTQIKF